MAVEIVYIGYCGITGAAEIWGETILIAWKINLKIKKKQKKNSY